MVMNQIIANILLLFIEAVLILFAVKTGELGYIIASIVFGILTILFILQAVKVIKKEKGAKVKRDINYTVYIVLIIVTTFFIIFMSLLVKNISYRKDGVETTAIVYQVDKNIDYKTEYDSDGNPYQAKHEICDVYIKYRVETNEYKSKLDMSSCGYSKGDKVKIYYQKDNPNKFVNGSSSSLIILIVSTLFTGCVLLFIVYKLIKDGFWKKHTKKKV